MPRGHIFRWDLDKTYLKTEFDTVRDLVRTARLSAEERQNIPGSAALLRAIRDCAPEGSQHEIYFISGSPEQMRGVIERKFALDGVSPDGFVLKPTVSNLLRGRFRAVRSQVEYKLRELIAMRAEAPIGTPETLFGDDAESDAFIYSLYADVLAGRVDRATLARVLKSVGAYRDQIDSIAEGLESIVHEDPVRRVIIHLDRRTPLTEFAAYVPLVVPIYSHFQTAIVLCLDRTLAVTSIRSVAFELILSYGMDVGRLEQLADDILARARSLHGRERLEELADLLSALAQNDEAWVDHTLTDADPNGPETDSARLADSAPASDPIAYPSPLRPRGAGVARNPDPPGGPGGIDPERSGDPDLLEDRPLRLRDSGGQAGPSGRRREPESKEALQNALDATKRALRELSAIARRFATMPEPSLPGPQSPPPDYVEIWRADVRRRASIKAQIKQEAKQREAAKEREAAMRKAASRRTRPSSDRSDPK